MNDSTIALIAQAVLANTEVLQSLVDHLPHEAKEAIAAAVQVETPKPAPTPVAPVVVPPAPVAPAPVAVSPSSSPAMPAPPVFAPAPVAAPAPIGVPFTDGKGLIDYVMGVYKKIGAARGQEIQNVLTAMGTPNINDVRPDQYAALFAGIEAIK
jgi:hypothetical protein